MRGLLTYIVREKVVLSRLSVVRALLRYTVRGTGASKLNFSFKEASLVVCKAKEDFLGTL